MLTLYRQFACFCACTCRMEMEKPLAPKKQKRPQHADRYEKHEQKHYDSPICSREGLIALLEKHGKPMALRHIAKSLSYSDGNKKKALENRLTAMVRDGQLLCNRRGHYLLAKELKLYKGEVFIEKNGFGVIKVADAPDILMPPRQAATLMDGDLVWVRAGQKMIRQKRLGVLVEIISRANTTILGRYQQEQGTCYVVPYRRPMMQQPIWIEPGAFTANHGDYVMVDILKYPSRKAPAMGKISKVLGDAQTASLEIELAILGHDLPHVWPEAVQQQSDQLAKVPVTLTPGRLDLRSLPFVTIDGVDAKDFDDAIYVASRGDLGWTLYVAIADVSHYVQPDSPLDQEAFKRGTSIYFPNHVIPMLPEVLSNGLCSLVPHEDRCVMVAKMDVSPHGNVEAHMFFRALIHSHARLTYRQVADMDAGQLAVPDFWQEPLHHLQAMYAVLKQARAERGAISFETQETCIVYGQMGRIEKIVPYERLVSHCFVEECMLLANQSVARFLLAQKHQAVFRVHGTPTPEKAAQLHQFLSAMGVTHGFDHMTPTAQAYNNLLNRCKTRPDFELIQTMMLRSMPQAIYTDVNSGHFGLAFDAYCHFTSPIRRYPDLLVHRILGRIIDQQPQMYTASTLQEMAMHCSYTERRAEECSRAVVARLKCYYMRDKVGQCYVGKIVSVTSFGLFVCLEDIHIEGLVHMTALPNDYYDFDELKHQLVGRRLKRTFGLGDRFEVRVARVDAEAGHIDFECVDQAS